MAKQHTEAPWSFDEPGGFIQDGERNNLCQFWNRSEQDFPNHKSNAERIVHCVNQMEKYERIAEYAQKVVMYPKGSEGYDPVDMMNLEDALKNAQQKQYSTNQKAERGSN